MRLFDPEPPPFDPLEWERKPLAERVRMACQAWAEQGFGAPAFIFAAYALKIAAYVGVWFLLCWRTPGLGAPGELLDWWAEPQALQQALVWSLTFEILGLGCGSGPLTGRYLPPVGGALYFLRPGTIKLPVFEGAPIIGAARRSWLDVGLYGGTLAALGWTMLWPGAAPWQLWLLLALVPALGVLDKTLFLAARAEHFWVMLACLAWTGIDADSGSGWVASTKVVALALWFWAGVSKLNHHFPSVVCVMASNNPTMPFPGLRRRLYRAFPDDLRPSTLSVVLAHAGTAIELGVPLLLAFGHAAPHGVWLAGIVGMLYLHGYITSNVPMGVPLEWNVVVVYGGLVLFAGHPEVAPFAGLDPALIAFLITSVIAVPLVGNLFPDRVSFLLAMRYYAGNWPVGLWLFRGDKLDELEALTKSARWLEDQLAPFYAREVFVGLYAKSLAFRFMHLHGRAFARLIPRAVGEAEVEDYFIVEGELVGGMTLGWNFGEGHLHNEQLLRAVQAQCGFAEGELRCIFLEPQALGGRRQKWRIVDAATGLVEAGEVEIASLVDEQPWDGLSLGSASSSPGVEGSKSSADL